MSGEMPFNPLNLRQTASWHEVRLLLLAPYLSIRLSEDQIMNSFNSMLSRLSDVARDDSDTVATAVLTGLMAVLALIVLV